MAERKSSLTHSKRWVITEMQRINFGRVENLILRGGDPVLNPPPRIVREIKLCAENGPRSEVGRDDFVLKAQVRDLFAHMEAMGDGVIRCIEVKHGLPFRMTVEEDAA